LYTTGVPEAFEVAYRAATSSPQLVERRVHQLLEEYRTTPKREFFRVSVDKAIDAVCLALIETTSLDSWKNLRVHTFSTGDRTVLTLKAGQVFVLINYESFADVMVGNAEIIDFWQAHSDGDILEIYATDSPTHVSGFSDGDFGSTDDPVPYLNREKTVANSSINGRERLMPGERLVWLPAPKDVERELSVVLESQNYCQIVSRTSNPVTGLDGLPLLLNNFSWHDELWYETNRPSVEKALTLPAPRTWSPRHNRDSMCMNIGSEPPDTDYWLPQLKKRKRK